MISHDRSRGDSVIIDQKNGSRRRKRIQVNKKMKPKEIAQAIKIRLIIFPKTLYTVSSSDISDFKTIIY